MGILHTIGDQLIPEQAFLERSSTAAGSAELESTRSLAPQMMRVDMNGEPVPFTPIGIGRPLTIEVQRIYRGDNGGSAFGFFGQPDLLCVSATRSTSQFKKAPRAINLLDQDIDRDRRFHEIHAAKDGTTLLYQTPSVTDPSPDPHPRNEHRPVSQRSSEPAGGCDRISFKFTGLCCRQSIHASRLIGGEVAGRDC